MKLAEKQPKPNREPTVHRWCRFWCNSSAHVIHKFNNFIAAPMPLVMWALARGHQSDAMEGVSFASVERGKPQTKPAGQ
jgi:hypothetical protein